MSKTAKVLLPLVFPCVITTTHGGGGPLNLTKGQLQKWASNSSFSLLLYIISSGGTMSQPSIIRSNVEQLSKLLASTDLMYKNVCIYSGFTMKIRTMSTPNIHWLCIHWTSAICMARGSSAVSFRKLNIALGPFMIPNETTGFMIFSVILLEMRFSKGIEMKQRN